LPGWHEDRLEVGPLLDITLCITPLQTDNTTIVP
jgi:hypothetical protein